MSPSTRTWAVTCRFAAGRYLDGNSRNEATRKVRATAPTNDSRITCISILTYEGERRKNDSGYNRCSIESG